MGNEMKRYWQVLSLLILTIFLIVITTPLVSSQGEISWDKNIKDSLGIIQAQVNSQGDEEIAPEIPEKQANPQSNQQDFPVILDGETLFNVRTYIEGLPAEERAKETSEILQKIAKNFRIPIDSLKIVKLKGVRIISAEREYVFAVLEADAKTANRPLDELAEEYLQKIQDAIARYREERSMKRLIQKILIWVFDTTVAIVLLIVLRKILKRINRLIEAWRGTRFRPLRIQSWQLLSVDQEANLFLGLVKLIYWVIIAVILLFYLVVLSYYFPQTKIWGETIRSSFFKALEIFGKALLDYLPNLFTIVLTLIVTFYIIRFFQIFFKAIDRGTLSLPGFDQEWAKPTERLTIILIIALAFATIFPLLPGAQSPAFQGLSIFVGALFTLGGASAIANLVGGIVIIYTRAFRVGDIIELDKFKGKVQEKTILSTRIRTINNEIITVPNAILTNSSIVNYNATLRELNEPMVVRANITLGYDVPWRLVEQVLVEAASATPDILEEPSPFIKIISLDDFYVNYELRAYTNNIDKLGTIYKELPQNILDKCNEAEIEILSPHYSAVRDGNQNTIPEDYLPKGYTAPGFRVHLLDQLFNQRKFDENLREKGNRDVNSE